MNPLGSFTGESLLEQGVSVVKKVGDTAAQGVKVTAQTAAAQLTGASFGKVTDAAISMVSHDSAAFTPPPTDNDEFVRELYGAEHNQQTQPNAAHASAPPQQMSPQPSLVMQEDQHKLASTRHQLDALMKQQHMDSYFNPTFNRSQHQGEESVVDKNEREEQEKKFEEFEKQKKKPDFALQRAQTKTEGSPGASG